MGRTACIQPQCLYKGALYIYLFIRVILFRSFGTTYQSPRVKNPVDRQDVLKRRQSIITIRCVSCQESADLLCFVLTFPLPPTHFNRSGYAGHGGPSVRVRFRYPSWRWLAHLFPRRRPKHFTSDTQKRTVKSKKFSDNENLLTSERIHCARFETMGTLIENDSSVCQRSQPQISAQQRHVKWQTCPCSESHSSASLIFRHRASCILGQAFHYSPENAFCIFNQQIYFIIWYLLDRASLI